MNTLLTAAALFSMLLSHARSPSGLDSDRRISTTELQYALVALEMDGDGVTRQESNLVREALFQSRRLLTPEAQQTADAWLSTQTGAASSRAKPIRRVEAFRATLSWLTVGRGNEGLTPFDARLLLSILDSRPSVVRVLEVREWVTAQSLEPATKEVFEKWLQRFEPAPLPKEFAQVIAPALDGLLWMSESDSPIHAVAVKGLPVWPLSKAQMRQLLNEPATVTVDQVTLKQLFSWVEAALGSQDPAERTRAERFRDLRKVLESNLNSIRAFKVGDIDRDLVILGRTKDGTVCGLVTRVIET